MKLEKVTNSGKPTENRWYDDACGTALALELVGERWALLIVRELMFGGRRFGEIKAGLGGVSANVLTQRLAGLEAVGIIRRRRLPPPASAQFYELREWGCQSERAIQELGRWAVRSPRHDPTLPLSAASLMMSFRTMYAGGGDGAVGFRFGEERFTARLGEGVAITREEPDGADAVFTTDPMTMASIVYGARPIADAQAAGVLTLTGDRAAAERFVRLFPLPPKLGG